MTAIVGGNGLGLSNGSASLLGARGQLGSAQLGLFGDQVYVNASTGNLLIRHQDQFLAAVGQGVGAVRTYNSQGQFDDDNGDNWKIGLYRAVSGLSGTVNTAGSTIDRIAGDGAVVRYVYNTARGVYLSTATGAAEDSLSFDASKGHWLWTDGARRITEGYDAGQNGRLLWSSDLDGNRQDFFYDANGMLSRVTNASGETTHFRYSGNQLVGIDVQYTPSTTGSQPSQGVVWLSRVRYEYDGSNRLSRVVTDLTPEDNSIADGNVFWTQFNYEGDSKRVSRIAQQDGSSLDITYQLVNGEWRVDSTTDAFSRRTTYSYFTAGDVRTEVRDPAGGLTIYRYDAQGRWTSVSQRDASTGNISSNGYTYDAKGNVASITDGANNTTVYRYDSNNNRIYERNADGAVIERVFGTANQLLSETRYAGNDPDGDGPQAASAPATTRFIYDSENHLRFTVSAQGRLSELRYDARGQRTSEIIYAMQPGSASWAGATTTETEMAAWVANLSAADRSNAQRTDYLFDTRGLLSQSIAYTSLDGSGSGISDGSESRVRYVYDQAGLLLQRIDARQTITSYVYDGLGRQLAEVRGTVSTAVQPQANFPQFVSLPSIPQPQGLRFTMSDFMVRFSNKQVSFKPVAQDLPINSVVDFWAGPDGTLQKIVTPSHAANQLPSIDDKMHVVRVITGPGGVQAVYLRGNLGLASAQLPLTPFDSASFQQEMVVPAASGDWQANSNVATGAVLKNSTGALYRVIVGGTTDGTAPTGTYIGGTFWHGSTLLEYVGSAQFSGTLKGSRNGGINWYMANLAAGDLAASMPAVTKSHLLSAIKNLVRDWTQGRSQVVGSRVSGASTGGVVWECVTGGTTSAQPAFPTNAAVGTIVTEASGVSWRATGKIHGNASWVLSDTDPAMMTVKAADSHDSYAATLVWAVQQYVAATGDTQWLTEASTHQGYSNADVLMEVLYANVLTQMDGGLVRTFQNDQNPAGGQFSTRYLMDNVETWAGLNAGAQLMARLGKQDQANYLGAFRDGNLAGIESLWQEDAGAYRFAVGANMAGPELKDSFYPHASSQYWALRFGVPLNTERLQRASAYADALCKDWPQRTDTSEFANLGTYYGRYLQGKTGELSTVLDLAAARHLRSAPGGEVQPLGFNVADAALYLVLRQKEAALPAPGTIQYDYVSRTVIEQGARYRDIGGTTQLTTQRQVFRENGGYSVATYNALGQLISLAEYSPANSVIGETLYGYDAAGQPRMVQDAIGNRVYQFHDALGRKLAQVDGDGSLSEYRYNGEGQLTQLIRHRARLNVPALLASTGLTLETLTADRLPLGVQAGDEVEHYEYDKAGRLAKTLDGEGYLTERRYDGMGRLYASIRYATRQALKADGRLPSPAVDPLMDHVERTFYDRDGLVSGTMDADGYFTEYSRDGAGQLAKKTLYATKASLAQRNAINSQSPGIASSDADINEYHLYDGKGQLMGIVDGERHLTEFTYNANGQRTGTIRYATQVIHATGRGIADLRPATGERQRVDYEYNARNLLSKEVAADGTVTNYTYDHAGVLIATTRAAGTIDARTQTRRVDSRGLVTAELGGEGAQALAQAGDAAAIEAIWQRYAVQYRYDAAGQRISMTDANGLRTLYYYDADGRLAAQINAAGEVLRNSYNTMNRLVEKRAIARRLDAASLAGLAGGRFDAALGAKLDALQGSDDNTLAFDYDVRGLLKQQTDALGFVTTSEFNAFGELALRTTQIDKLGRTSRDKFEYDQRGNLRAQTADAGGPTASTQTIDYDAFGRVERRTDARGNATVYGYDRNGRQVSVKLPLQSAITTTYDAFDRIVATTDASGTTTREYNVAQRSYTLVTPEGIRQTVVNNRHGQQVTVTDGKNVSTTYEYDRDGRLLRTIDGEGRKVEAGYDAGGRLETSTDANGIVTQFSYDAANRVLSKTLDPQGLNLTTSFTYDAQGRVATETDARGVVTRKTYDAVGQLKTISVDAEGGDALKLLTSFDYDGRGKVLKVTDSAGLVTEYQYDNQGRRTSETVDPQGAALRTEYFYDAQGNLVGKRNPNQTKAAATYQNDLRLTSYVYDTQNRLSAEIDASGAVVRYEYDAAGRPTITRRHATLLDMAAALAGLQEAIEPETLQDQPTLSTMLDDTWLPTIPGGPGLPPMPGPLRSIATDGAALASRTLAAHAHDQLERKVYDKDGRVRMLIDGAGGVTSFAYDKNGNVVERVAHANKLDLASVGAASTAEDLAKLLPDHESDQRVVTVYDKANRAIATAASHRRIADGRREWAVTELRYDANGNLLLRRSLADLLTSAAPSAADVTAWATAANHVNPADLQQRYAYDAANRRTAEAVAVGRDAQGVTQWAITQHAYDKLGQLLRRTEYASTKASPAGAPADADWRAWLQAAPVQTPADRLTRYAYDDAGRRTTAVDAAGAVTRMEYDRAGRVLASTRHDDIPAGITSAHSAEEIAALVRADAAKDRSERHEYDAAGRLRFTRDAGGYLREWRYDGLGNVLDALAYQAPAYGSGKLSELVAQAGAARKSSYSYDARGRVLSSTDALLAVEYFSYDGAGNKVAFTNKARSTWNYRYDGAGRLLAEQAPLTDIHYTDGSKVALRPETAFEYDAIGNLTARIEAANVDRQARRTEYKYDAAGRQVSTVLPSFDIYDAAGDGNIAVRNEKPSGVLEIKVSYDALGNAIANKDVGGSFSYKAYDQAGRVRYEIDAKGFVTGYERNAFGDVLQLTRFKTALADNVERSVAAIATALGKRSAEDMAQDRRIITTYDNLGRTVTVRQPEAWVSDASNPGGNNGFLAAQTTRTRYNAFGDVIQQLVYGADRQGNALTEAASTRFYFDLRGLKRAQVQALHDGNVQEGYLTTFGYDDAGNLTEQNEFNARISAWSDTAHDAAASDPNRDRLVSYGYDGTGRKTRETRVKAQAHSGADITTVYDYDAVGNLNKVTHGAVLDASGKVSSHAGIDFTYYDSLGRTIGTAHAAATGVAQKSPVKALRLDALGNVLVRIEYANPLGSEPSTSAMPAVSADPLNDRITTTAYDIAGHAIQVIDAEGKLTYNSYDQFGRVAKTWRPVTNAAFDQPGTPPETAFELYRYDELGRLVEVKKPGNRDIVSNAAVSRIVQHTDYNEFGEVTERRSGGQIIDLAKYDNAGRAWLTMAGGVMQVNLHDAQGNVTTQLRSTAKEGALILPQLKQAQEALVAPNLLRTDMRYNLLGHMVDARNASDQRIHMLERQPDGSWAPTLPGTHAISSGLVILDSRANQGWTYRVEYSRDGDAWTDAGSRISRVDGYPVFNTTGLASGRYSYRITAQPEKETVFSLASGTLEINSSASTVSLERILQLHLTILGGAPDARSFDYYMQRANQGATMEQIAVEMLESAEAVAFYGPAKPDNYGNIMAKLFERSFGMPRSSETAYLTQLAIWTARLGQASPYSSDMRGRALVDLCEEQRKPLSFKVDVIYRYMVLHGGTNRSVLQDLLGRLGNTLENMPAMMPAIIEEARQKAEAERTGRQLARAFVAVLGRAADHTGYNHWMEKINSGATLASVASQLLAWPESLAPALVNPLDTPAYHAQLVRHVLGNLLSRVPSAAESEKWISQLNNGTLSAGAFVIAAGEYLATDASVAATDRQLVFSKTALSHAYASLQAPNQDLAMQVSVARALMGAASGDVTVQANAERIRLVLEAQATAAGAHLGAVTLAAGNWPLEQQRMMLSRLYVLLRNRAPDNASLNLWLDALRTDPATTPQSIAQSFLADPGSDYPGTLSHADYVRKLWSTAVGSAYPPPQAQLDGWVARLGAGSASRAAVALELIDWLVGGAGSAYAQARALFENKAAAGLTYALNMQGNDVTLARAMLGKVSATDVSEALSMAYQPTADMIRALAEQYAVAARDAASLLADPAVVAQEVANAAREVRDANAALVNNQLAAPYLRAARLYMAVLNRGAQGTYGLDVTGLTNMARNLQGASRATEIAMVQSLLDSAEGSAIFPSAGFTPAGFIAQLHLNLTGKQVPAAVLEQWVPRVASSSARAQVVLDFLDAFIAPSTASLPPGAKVPDGLVTFHQQVANALATVKAQADSRAASANQALATAIDAQNRASDEANAQAAYTQAVANAAGSHGVNALNIARLVVGLLGYNAAPQNVFTDFSGFVFWIRGASQGDSMHHIAERFLVENPAKFPPGQSNASFLNQLCLQVLGRPSLPTDNSFWLDALESRQYSRGRIAWDFIDSLINRPKRLAEEFTYRAAFEQRVYDAVSALSGTQTTEGMAAAQRALNNAWNRRQAATSALSTASTQLNNANNLSAATDPNVVAAQGAINFQASSNRAYLQKVLVGFYQPTDYNTVRALLAELDAGRTTYADILRPLVGTMANKREFYSNLYRKVLLREPEEGGLNGWLANDTYTDPGVAAKAFFDNAQWELHSGISPGRNTFPNEVAAVVSSHQNTAQPLANSYNQALQSANDRIASLRYDAQVAYNGAYEEYRAADRAWQNASSFNEVAKVSQTTNARMLAMAGASVAVSNTTLASINSAAAARAAALALDPSSGTWTLAQTISYTKPYVDGSNSIPGNINLSKAMASMAAANIALMLARMDLADAAEATRRLASLVQVYLVVLDREPTLFELNAGMQLLPPANCPPADLDKAYGRIAGSLIADNPQAYAPGMSNFDFVARIYRNASNKVVTAVDAGVQFWLDALTRTENRYSRGELAYGMVYSLVTGTINDDSVTFNNKTASALRNVDFATRAAAVSPDVSGFVASLSRMLADKASAVGAAADAALTPAARYAIEATQLYLALLGRTPEPAALANVIAQRSNGTPLAQITQSILQSAEIQPLLPSNIGNAAFVDSLVRHMLGREPDAAERSELLGKLDSGQLSRAQLVEFLIAATNNYAGGDPIKAAARTRFMARITTGLDTMAATLNSLAGDLAKANIASLSSLLGLKLLDYTDGIDQGLESQVGNGKVVLHQLDRYTIDRWGNIVTALDLRDPNWVTTYTYDASNQVVKVAQTGTPNAKALYNQTTYDKLGRVLTTTVGADAAVANSGHTTRYTYDGNGNLAEEVRADGGTTTYTVDVFGQRTMVTQFTNSTNSTTIVTHYGYDRLGRQTSRTSAPVDIYYWNGGSESDQVQTGKIITETYVYDELGRRVMATNTNNSTLADPNRTTSTRMRYDLGGNLIEARDAAGKEILRVYDQYNNKVLERSAADETRWTHDQHGRITSHTDLAGNHWSYTYNEAGQLTETTGTVQEWDSTTSSFQQRTQVVSHAYDSYSGQLLETTESVINTVGQAAAIRKISRFSYDAAGQRVAESVWVADATGKGGRLVQNQVLTYDQYGRTTDITSAIAGADYKIKYVYDDFGNRKKVTTSYTSDNGNRKDIIVNYQYDAMNRVTDISGSTKTTYGVPVAEYLNPYKPPSKSYDDISDETEVVWKEFDNKDLEHRIISYDWLGNRISESTNGVMESYRYDALGRLSEIRNAANDLVGHRHYDGAGRVISSLDKGERRLNDYGLTGRLDVQHTFTNDRLRSKVNYNYNDDGTLESYLVTDAYENRQITTHKYGLKRDSALLTETTVRNFGPGPEKTSKMVYDINGNMVAVTGEDARTMIYDGAGHVLEKLQDGVLTHTLIANGEMIGSSNNAFETFSSVYESVTAPAMSDVGVYVVQSKGETLQSIAKALWGDARLWYMIAEANGLTDNIALAVGQQLKIPQRATAIHNSAETFKPYNSSEIIGSTTPELAMPPPPAAKKGCGGLAQIVMIVVAVVATIYTAGAAASAMATATGVTGGAAGASAFTAAGMLSAGTTGLTAGMAMTAGAIGGAVGSIASQAIGMAMGVQDKFSWKGVALSAVGGGASAGVASLASQSTGFMAEIFKGTETSAVVARSVASNMATQAVGVVTGLQSSFNWRSVAAAGAGAAVGSYMNKGLNVSDADLFTERVLKGTASGFAAGATAALMRGGKIAIAQIATDAFGNALGQSLANSMRPTATAARSTSKGIGKYSYSGMDSGPLDIQPVQMNYTDDGDKTRSAMRNFFERGQEPAPQMSYARDWAKMSATEQAFIQNDIGFDYQTSPHDAEGNLSSVIYRARHISPDERLAWAQEKVSNFVNETDEIASSAGSSDGFRMFAAATYGVRKFAGSAINGAIGLPRVLTNNGTMSALTYAANNPTQTINGAIQHFKSLPTQDKLVGVLEVALPMKGGIQMLAGRIPKAGGFLSGELGYRSGQGVTLSANGKLYGFVGEGVKNYRAGPFANQAGSVEIPRFGEIAVDGDFKVAKHGDMPSPRPGYHSHHGVMSAWMKANYSEYNPDLAPAVLMPDTNHRATFGVYNTWRAEARSNMGGTFEWSNVSEGNMKGLSEKMFDAADVPATTRQEYWDWYQRMIEALNK